VNDLSTVEARQGQPYPEVRSGYVSGTSFDSDSETGVCAGAMGHFMGYADDLSDAWNEEEDMAVFSLEATTGPAAALNLDEAVLCYLRERSDGFRQASSVTRSSRANLSVYCPVLMAKSVSRSLS
jgi:hypothetical protein